MVGARIGSYEIVRSISEGGMGAVYEAIQQPIGRRVAIKILHAELARQQELVKRFFNEARATNLIPHPTIVQISDFGYLPDGTPYIVMEYLEGLTLAERLLEEGGKLDEGLAQHICWQLSSALAAAHTRKIVHRDLKPGNVMLVPDPVMPSGTRVKLLDFGIAKLSGRTTQNPQTKSGSVLGTPLYMSPEQCEGKLDIDGKSDVYSMGVMFFEMLAGKPPFTSDSDLALLNMHIRIPPPSLLDLSPEVSQQTATLLTRLLKKDPKDRPTMAEVSKTLQTLGSSLSQQHTAIGAEDATVIRRVRSGEPALPLSGAGQQLARLSQRQRAGIFTTAALLMTCAVGLSAGLALRSRNGSEVRPPASNPESVRAAASSITQPVGQVGTQPERASPAKVFLLLDSEPSGATVLSAEDERALGRTPWKGERERSDSDLWVILRKQGYRDRLLRLSLRQGNQRTESLSPDPAMLKLLKQRRIKAAPAAPPPSRTAVDEAKRKLTANPNGSSGADIDTENYRIVD